MTWYSDAVDSAINFVNDTIESVTGTVTQYQQATQEQLNDLEVKARAFQKTYQTLLQYQGKNIPEEYKAEYENIMSQGEVINAMIEAVYGEINQMGVAPLVVAGVVVAVIAAIGAWLVVATPLADNLEKVMVAGTDFSKSLFPLVAIGAAIFFWKDIKGFLPKL